MPAPTIHGRQQYICPHCGGTREVVGLCNDRTCRSCAWRRRRRLIREYGELASSIKNPYFITFTWPRVMLSRQVVKDIRASFKSLYKAGGWSGIYQIELGTVKRESLDCCTTGNVHIHAIVEDGSFMKADLAMMWWWASERRAYIVNTERIWERKGAMHYLTKHMLKAAYKGALDDGVRGVINRTLRGVRLVETFGRFRGMLPDRPDNPVLCDCGAEMSPVFYFTSDLLYELSIKPPVLP